tara:strand:- start:113 stop:589 length:477 start_codon:yes stop_codon:yes gene_type:complete
MLPCHGHFVARTEQRDDIQINDGIFDGEGQDPEVVFPRCNLALEIEAGFDVEHACDTGMMLLPKGKHGSDDADSQRQSAHQPQRISINRPHLRRNVGQAFETFEYMLGPLKELLTFGCQVELPIAPGEQFELQFMLEHTDHPAGRRCAHAETFGCKFK